MANGHALCYLRPRRKGDRREPVPGRQDLDHNPPSPVRSEAEESALAVLDRFKAAFDAADAEALAALFAPKAIFLGTMMPGPTRDRGAVLGYFQRAASSNLPKGIAIDSHELLALGETAVIVSGQCTFSQTVNGKVEYAQARFTFVVAKDGGRWAISHFHSSILPPPPKA